MTGDHTGGLSPASKAVARAVRHRLLAEPSRSLDELDRRWAADPAGLILLDDPQRGPRCPSFQFDAEGSPLFVVRQINRLLLADKDP
ncbi:hypothetical protein AB0M05_43990 [Streptomyces violaceusniger]|uniref:hypothetical protein n=1 Tax=Streptomyces violaceusniger TaxID=68280 RepID=UPI00342A2BE0